MTSSIVCGIDASTHAGSALRVASALAQRLSLRLILVHAIPVPTPDLLLTAPTRMPAPVEEIDLLGREAGERLLSEAADAHDDVTAHRRLEIGSAAERLRTVACEEEAQFVVVGSHGDGAPRAAIIGSISAAVIRDAPCPVVVVPPKMAGPPLQGERIVCGVRGGEDGPPAIIAARLARALDLPLTLSHVLPPRPESADPVPAGGLPPTFDHRLEATPRHELGMVHDLLQTADPKRSDVQLRSGDPVEQLVALSASARAVLLVVGSRGSGPLRGGVLGPVSREIVRRATRPVVICRREEPT
jgi:nucleotide-binding universal stress UspA family protein